VSGTKVYDFNSLGFRGEEYNSNAKRTIFISGCSLTFGIGLNLDETWGAKFKKMYAKEHKYCEAEVNLLNFSQGGASNNYIARTLLSQPVDVKPDLVLVHFTYSGRSEGFIGQEPLDICPWLIEESKDTKSEWAIKTQGYYLYYSPEVGFLNSLKNMLLLQFYYRAKNINYLFTWETYKNFQNAQFIENPSFSALINLVDWSRFAPHALSDSDVMIDKAADTHHPGPLSHDIFAERLFKFYLKTRK
jgi:hypothetical protein